MGSFLFMALNIYKCPVSSIAFISELDMSSTTITFSGNIPFLSVNFFPPIELDSKYEYECGLIDFQSFHSIPNIDEFMNKIHVGNYEISIPTGTYEIEALNDYIKNVLGEKHNFSVRSNKNTLHSEIFCSLPIDFAKRNTIAPLLGFSCKKLTENIIHTSQNLVDICRVNVVRIECDLIKGSYFNHRKTHTLHEFFPKVAAGFKIVESPQNVIYFPITKKAIDSISLSILDQNSEPINFRGENITIRIHIRKIN